MLSQLFSEPYPIYHPHFLPPYNLPSPKLLEDIPEIPQYPKKTGKWTQEEDDLLRKYVEIYGEKQWRKISQYIPGRTSIQCLHRWSKILRPGLIKGPWTPEEDKKLIAWIKAGGVNKKWAEAASVIVGRSGKQCRERWANNLSPNVKKGEWKKEEDELIFELYKKHGSSWSKIARFVPGRTENSIKNRFYSTLRRIAGDRKKIKSKSDSPSENSVEDEQPIEESFSKGESESPQPLSTLYKLLQDNLHLVDAEKDVQDEDNEELNQKAPQPLSRDSSSPLEVQENNASSLQSVRSETLFSFNGDKLVIGRDGSILQRNPEENADKASLFLKQDKMSQNVQKIVLSTSNKLSNTCIFNKPSTGRNLSPLELNISSLSNFSTSFERLKLSRRDNSDLSNPIEIKLEDSVQLQIPKNTGNLVIPELAPLNAHESLNKLDSLSFKSFTLSHSPCNLFQSDLSEKSSLGQLIVVERRFSKDNLEQHLGFRSVQGLRTRKEISQESQSTQVSECEANELNGRTVLEMLQREHFAGRENERSEADILVLLKHLYSLQDLLKIIKEKQQNLLLKTISNNQNREIKVKVEASENNEDSPIKKIKLH